MLASHNKPGCLFLAACGWLSLGCETIAEKMTEKAVELAVENSLEKGSGADVDIDTSKQGVSFKVRDEKGGELVLDGQSGKVPDNWPKDVPAYPGAKVTASMTSEKGGMLMLETTDSAESVLGFYKSKLGHMKETATMNAGGTSLVTYGEQNGARQVVVGATARDGKTMVHLQLAQKSK